jgi:uncharacterized short protein YbdD (DUF466 family)
MPTVQRAERNGLLRTLARFARGARDVSRKVFGVPDYEAYAEHMRRSHPAAVPLTRGEFLAWALERRHADRGRCC